MIQTQTQTQTDADADARAGFGYKVKFRSRYETDNGRGQDHGWDRYEDTKKRQNKAFTFNYFMFTLAATIYRGESKYEPCALGSPQALQETHGHTPKHL